MIKLMLKNCRRYCHVNLDCSLKTIKMGTTSDKSEPPDFPLKTEKGGNTGIKQTFDVEDSEHLRKYCASFIVFWREI